MPPNNKQTLKHPLKGAEGVSIPLETVFKAYFSCRKHKRNTEAALQFEMHWPENCEELWREINQMTWKHGRSVAFVVSDPKPREVFAAQFRDRVVHHLVALYVQPIMESIFIDGNYSTRPGKGTLYGQIDMERQIRRVSENYTRESYIMKLDIRSFFMTIDRRIMYSMLMCMLNKYYRGENREILDYLIREIVFNRPEKDCIRKSPEAKWRLLPKGKSLFEGDGTRGLPIGNITSQLFALLYLNFLDHYILRRHPNIGYGRYVDDIILVARDKRELLVIRAEISEWLENTRLGLHPNKVYLQEARHGVTFVGGTLLPGRRYISERTVGNYNRRVYGMNRLAELHPDFAEKHAAEFVATLNSYFGYLHHYNEYRLMKRMARQIGPQWKEHIVLIEKNGFMKTATVANPL